MTFWSKRRALSGEEARRRLPEVVCLLRQESAVVGSSSAYATDVSLIGGRRFWVYRNLLDPEVEAEQPALIRATFAALEQEFDGSSEAPIGLCALAGPDLRRRRPEAEWSDPRMIYAGYLPEGHQVRIAYFEGAVIT